MMAKLLRIMNIFTPNALFTISPISRTGETKGMKSGARSGDPQSLPRHQSAVSHHGIWKNDVNRFRERHQEYGNQPDRRSSEWML